MSKTINALIGHDGITRQVTYTVPDDEPDFWGGDKELKVVGKERLIRPEGIEKVTGKAKYTFDINRPNMLHAAMLTCPYANARIDQIDTSEAEAMPGVKTVLLSSNYRTATYAGYLLAAVAAETLQQARDAAARINVIYNVLSFRTQSNLEEAESDPDESRDEAVAKTIKEGRLALAHPQNRGNIGNGFAQADEIVDAVYETPVTPHCCLETHGCVAEWNGNDLTVWYSTQGIWSAKNEIVTNARIPASQVRVITQHMGGGFGSKLQVEPFAHMCVQMAKSTQRPVKFMASRYEDIVQCGNKPGAQMTVRIGAKRDGTLTAISSANRNYVGVSGGESYAGPFHDNYDCPNISVSESMQTGNSGPSRAFRAPGKPQGTFGVEMAVEEMAMRLEMDPIELRLKNVAASELDARKYLLQVGAEKFGWKEKFKKHGSSPGPIKRGVGVAMSFWPYYASARGATARCTVNPDGSVEIANGCQDLGTGVRTVMLAVAAETLEIPASSIRVWIGDTGLGLIGPQSGGSVTTANVAPAVHTAAYRALLRLLERVALEWQVPVDQVEYREGIFADKNTPSRSITWTQAASLNEGDPIVTTGEDRARPSIRGVTLGPGMRGAQFAEVEVNTLTGKVRCLKVTAVHECGRVMARSQAETQLCGGVNMGVSYALFENRILEPIAGRQINANFEGYKILGPMDAPEIDPVFIDLFDPVNNASARGLGEPSHIPTAAAIGCAVANALGVPVRSLPITPYKVLAALNQQKG